jgi:hypothetical protein
VRHHASSKFWQHYHELPTEIQKLADHCYSLLKRNPRHGSLHFKKVGEFWSVRVGIHYRAIAIENADDLIWFWIGHHADYERIIGNR